MWVPRAPAALALVGALGCGFGVTATACNRTPHTSTPDGTVRMVLEDLDNPTDDPGAPARVYELLGPASRKNLDERARQVSKLQGRHFEGKDMLASGLFGLYFRPKAMHTTVVGDRATVDVFGEDAQKEHASVLCIREPAGWRVEAGFPEP